MKKIVITGCQGFLGRNLINRLRSLQDVEVVGISRDDDAATLRVKLSNVDVVFHLAGVNRPESERQFHIVNVSFTEEIIQILEQKSAGYQLVFSSSTQALLDNPYGNSKKAAEDVIARSVNNGSAIIYRLPGVFGKWCKPEYNSVVATFCYRIATDKKIEIREPEHTLRLAYIDDVVTSFIECMNGEWKKGAVAFKQVEPVYQVTLGDLAQKIYSIKDQRKALWVPEMADTFKKKLYATYISYLPEDDFSYGLELRSDQRGSLFEVLKSGTFGQIFLSTTHPGVVRGNHYHHSKVEKFCVIAGKGLIQFRKIDDNKVIEYHVSGDKPQVVDIPPGYTHNICNVGETEMITLFWANEIFDTTQPDTYFEKV